jgi:hypothetical protein
MQRVWIGCYSGILDLAGDSDLGTAKDFKITYELGGVNKTKNLRKERLC